MRARRLSLGLLVSLATLAALDQVVQHALLGDGELRGKRIAPFDPPLFHSEQEALLARLEGDRGRDVSFQGALVFDAELGWCPLPDSEHGADRYDWAGARVDWAPLPRERRAGVRRVVAVGGSFTHGDEVGARESWVGVLEASAPDLEVVNLGVGGYGPGQARLRWNRDGRSLGADEVWLDLVPAVSLRAVTMYWPALGHWKPSVAFKPRFAPAAGGDLVLLPNPARSLQHLVELVSDQGAFLAAVGDGDHWVRRAPLAYLPAGEHWTSHSGLARLALTWHEGRGRDARAALRDPTSELYRVLVGIVLGMDEEVRELGAELHVLFLPDRGDLFDRARMGAAAWSGLAAELAAGGVRVHDLAEELVLAGALERPDLWRPGAHYGPELNRAVGEAARGFLAP